MANDIPLPSTWKALEAELEEQNRQFGMGKAYLNTARELGHLFFWKHFLVIARNRWIPEVSMVTVDNAIDATRMMLRRPNSEYSPYARSALAISEKELDMYVTIAATKIRAGEGAHVGELGVWGYSVYGLMEALSTQKFERVIKS